jgi:hypothetical protein
VTAGNIRALSALKNIDTSEEHHALDIIYIFFTAPAALGTDRLCLEVADFGYAGTGILHSGAQ